MADYNLANQTGASLRQELNGILTAIASNNAGADEPNPTFAHMWWADTGNDLLKKRNAANNAWIPVFSLSEARLLLAQIPNLPASKITSGTLDLARIPALGTSSIVNRSVTLAKMANGTAGRFIGFDNNGEPQSQVLDFVQVTAYADNITGTSGLTLSTKTGSGTSSVYTEPSDTKIFVGVAIIKKGDSVPTSGADYTWHEEDNSTVNIQQFTTSDVWNWVNAGSPEQVYVSVKSGRGGNFTSPSRSGGAASSGIRYLVDVTESVYVTVGVNGTNVIQPNDKNQIDATPGSASSFGSQIIAGGGGAASNNSNGSAGSINANGHQSHPITTALATIIGLYPSNTAYVIVETV